MNFYRLALLLVCFFPSVLFAAQFGLNSQDEYQTLVTGTDKYIELLFALRVVLAGILGALIGLVYKREFAIGPLLFAAVTASASLLTCVMLHGYLSFGNQSILAGIGGLVMAIGFIGASIVFRADTALEGLINAVVLLAAASIGIACGFGLNILAVIVMLMAALLSYIPNRLRRISRE